MCPEYVAPVAEPATVISTAAYSPWYKTDAGVTDLIIKGTFTAGSASDLPQSARSLQVSEDGVNPILKPGTLPVIKVQNDDDWNPSTEALVVHVVSGAGSGSPISHSYVRLKLAVGANAVGTPSYSARVHGREAIGQ